jgi:hypothetical protein
LISKDTERGWEQAGDISTLVLSLIRHQAEYAHSTELLGHDEIDDKRVVGLLLRPYSRQSLIDE